jgi:hypothetical protein
MKSFVYILAMVIAVASFAQPTITWSDPIPVSEEAFGNKSNRIAINSVGEPMVLHASSAGNPGLFLTVMSGGVFGTPIQVTPDTNIYLSESEGPRMAVSGDKIAVGYQISGEWEIGARVVMSDDGGQTWSDPYVLNPNATVDHFMPCIAYDPFDEPFAVLKWGANPTVEGVQLFNPSTNSFLDPIDGSYSLDGNAVCACCPSNPFSYNGVFYNIVRNNNDNTRDMWLSVSQNGVDWSDALDIDPTDWYINSCPATGASSTVMDDGTMVAAYMSGADGSRIFWSSVDLENLELIDSQQLDPSGSSSENHPSVTSSGDWVVTAWERNAGGYNVMMALSDAGPAAMVNSVVNVTDGLDLNGHKRNPSVVYDGELVHLAFKSSTAGVVVYMSGVISGTSEVEEVEASSWKVATLDHGWTIYGNSFDAEYILYDLNGRVVDSGVFSSELFIPHSNRESFIVNIVTDKSTESIKLLN